MNQFLEKYEQYSTEKLIDILVNKEDYQPAAVWAAEGILRERKVPEEELQAYIQTSRSRKVYDKRVADEPLPFPLKLFCLLLPVLALFVGKFLSTYYREEGRDQRASDIAVYPILGLLIWGISIGLLVWLL